MSADQSRMILPGESIILDIKVPPLKAGSYLLEIDLVSEYVCWFGENGMPTLHVSFDCI